MKITEETDRKTSNNLVHKRKRLGQYFSGAKLAKLLSKIAFQKNIKTVIDPMAGCGDMLNGCLTIGVSHKNLFGIEIDSSAYIKLKEAGFENKDNFLNCDSFDSSRASAFTAKHWDLVITNPPYVRYQLLRHADTYDENIPNSEEVRKGLIKTIESNLFLSATEKKIFQILAKSYSGLSDLAVPSWLLCASMVKSGGTLAMVLPESWLTRDYAIPVNYLLMRLFKLKYIVEDTSGKWFNNAQVKTLLLIATKRKKALGSAFEDDASTYLHIKLREGSSSDNSLVGGLFPESVEPEDSFYDYISSLDEEFLQKDDSYHSVSRIKTAYYRDKLKSLFFKQRWAGELEVKKVSNSVSFGNSIYKLLSENRLRTHFSTLESNGVGVGQGLRTGANKFFYVDRTDNPNIYKLDKVFSYTHISAPSKYLIPVVRKQAELPNNYLVKSDFLDGRVLALQEYSGIDMPDCSRQDIPESIELSQHLLLAEQVNIGTADSPKFFHELSAVIPNIKKASKGMEAKHWYMLPNFTQRHRPDLLMPRVNHNSPKTYLNNNRSAIVDANFTTLWVKGGSHFDEYMLLAFLNSDWVITYLEDASSKMGGGALKVEASHVKQIPVPKMNEQNLLKLSKLGKRLTSSTEETSHSLLNKINQEINSCIFGKERAIEISSIVKQQQKTRKTF